MVSTLRQPPWVLGIMALALSVTFALLTHQSGEMLAYNDSVSHLQIARRVLDSTSPGLAQLGGVWLPLPHILMLPLVWMDTLYYSGWAGTIVSMVSYIGATALLYAIVHDLTGSRPAAIAGASVFMLNPNVLYMQSTPMTELPLFVGLLGMVFGMQRWIRTERYGYLIVSAGAALLATLTRYEAWVLLVGMAVVLVAAAWWRGFDRERIEGTTIAFLTLAAAGIVAWLVWNHIIFGSALNFQSGEYAKPSLWVEGGEPAIGNLAVAIHSYSAAVVDNLGLVTVALGVAGGAFLLAGRYGSLRLLPTAATLGFYPFFVVALYLGQRPLHVMQVHGDLYNVRFGLVMLVPAAILTGFLVHVVGTRYGRGRRTPLIAGATVIAVALTAVFAGPATTRREPVIAERRLFERLMADAGSFLRTHHDGGKVLMESFGNEQLIFDARVDPSVHVYEGSYRQWEPALDDPAANDIEWIVMRMTQDAPDKVRDSLHGSSALRSYELAYENERYALYERR